KYEWYASFGLAFSVIWLFFKILELLGKLKNNKSN
ncbi:MAG: Bax inhibitor-1/YccA family protein, partial [Spirochaetales bacterium]|nr:Bax inhibitor-1/YccA family protein [Spirochaetales bacterium]